MPIPQRRDNNSESSTGSKSETSTGRNRKVLPTIQHVHVASARSFTELQPKKSTLHPLERSDTVPKNLIGKNFRNTLATLKGLVTSTRHDQVNVLRTTMLELKERQKYRFVLHPMSLLKRIWDFFTAFGILIVSWTIPIFLSFDWIEPHPTWTTANVFLDFWFIADILLHFRTGFIEYGVVKMNPTEIRHHYTHSFWFPVDVFSSIPYELFLQTPASKATRKSIKLLKYMKLPKLLRIGRIFRYLKKYRKYSSHITLFCGFLFFSNAISCTWVALLDPCDEITILTEKECDPENATSLFIRSYHNSILTMLCISTEYVTSKADILSGAYKTGIVPPHLYVWSTCIMIFGISTMSLLFGHTIFIIQSWSRAENAFRKKMDHVYYEMDSLNLPKNLRGRIIGYYDYLWINNRNLSEELLLLKDSSMSLPLKRQIAIYMYKDLLLRIPFFQRATDSILGMVCLLLRQVIYMPGDHIITEGEIGRELFMVVKGIVQVLPENCKVLAENEDPILLSDGSFFGEIGLVMEVYRTRSVKAQTMVELCILDKKGFNSILAEFPLFAQEMKLLVVQRAKMMFSDGDDSAASGLEQIQEIADENINNEIKKVDKMKGAVMSLKAMRQRRKKTSLLNLPSVMEGRVDNKDCSPLNTVKSVTEQVLLKKMRNDYDIKFIELEKKLQEISNKLSSVVEIVGQNRNNNNGV